MGHGGGVLIPSVRGRPAVLAATARVCDENNQHRGQGLVLPLRDGVVVLTCHHVIADIPQGGIKIALPDEHGSLRAPVSATFDARRSRPERDAVVLRISADIPPLRPLLHALDPKAYEGTLPKRATGYTYMATQTFDARVAAATRIELQVKNPGPWPNPPQRYVIPAAFRLADPTDARQGVSGAVVAYEGGVLGLAHFARAAGPAQEREVYLVPLSMWAEGWEELDALIEPLIDQPLRQAATVRRVRDVMVGIDDPSAPRLPDIVIAGYRQDVYFRRLEGDRAQQALARSGLLIIGRPKSGKTRLAWELIRKLPRAVMVRPHDPTPPAEFETAGLSGRDIVVLCDDLHLVAEQLQPLRWRNRFRDVANTVYFIATARDGLEWRRVRDNQIDLLNAIDTDGRVFVSKTAEGGQDLPFAVAKALARRYDLSDRQLASRYDGTPGSLTLDLRDMELRYRRLREEQLGGVPASRLLDCLKLLDAAGQSHLGEPLARAVAEQIRGDRIIAEETWEWLCRRTREEGFGGFTADREFQTYRPYLEQCVEYTPTATDLNRLDVLLRNRGQSVGLTQLAVARDQQDRLLDLCVVSVTRLEELLRDLTISPSSLWMRQADDLREILGRLEDLIVGVSATDARQANELQKARRDVAHKSQDLMEVLHFMEYKSLGASPMQRMDLLMDVRILREDLHQALVRLLTILMAISDAPRP